MVTTESATAAATAANSLGSGSEVSARCKFTFGVVNAAITSVVMRPTTPPSNPATRATITNSASATHDNLRPNTASRRPSFTAAGTATGIASDAGDSGNGAAYASARPWPGTSGSSPD